MLGLASCKAKTVKTHARVPPARAPSPAPGESNSGVITDEDLLDLSSLVVGIQSDKPALPGAPPGGPGAPPGEHLSRVLWVDDLGTQRLPVLVRLHFWKKANRQQTLPLLRHEQWRIHGEPEKNW